MNIVICGMCGANIPENEAETCWYCRGYLCFQCWDAYGHCGHPEADRINKEERERQCDKHMTFVTMIEMLSEVEWLLMGGRGVPVAPVMICTRQPSQA